MSIPNDKNKPQDLKISKQKPEARVTINKQTEQIDVDARITDTSAKNATSDTIAPNAKTNSKIKRLKLDKKLKRVQSSLYEDTLYAINSGDIDKDIPDEVLKFLPPQCMYDRLKSRKRKSSSKGSCEGESQKSSTSSGISERLNAFSVSSPKEPLSVLQPETSKSSTKTRLESSNTCISTDHERSSDFLNPISPLLAKSPDFLYDPLEDTLSPLSLPSENSNLHTKSRSRKRSSSSSSKNILEPNHGHPEGEYVPFSSDEKLFKQIVSSKKSKSRKNSRKSGEGDRGAQRDQTSSESQAPNLPGKQITKDDLNNLKTKNEISEVQTIINDDGEEVQIFWIQEKFKSVGRMVVEVDRLPRILCGRDVLKDGIGYEEVKSLMGVPPLYRQNGTRENKEEIQEEREIKTEVSTSPAPNDSAFITPKIENKEARISKSTTLPPKTISHFEVEDLSELSNIFNSQESLGEMDEVKQEELQNIYAELLDVENYVVNSRKF